MSAITLFLQENSSKLTSQFRILKPGKATDLRIAVVNQNLEEIKKLIAEYNFKNSELIEMIQAILSKKDEPHQYDKAIITALISATDQTSFTDPEVTDFLAAAMLLKARDLL